MPVHDRYGGIPGLPDSGSGYNQDPPPQPTPEQIAAFKAQLTEETSEKQAAHDRNTQETRIILARELRGHHLHVLFMGDQALLEARISGVGKAERAGGGRIALTIDIQMPAVPGDAAGRLGIPPVIEAHGDSVDIHLDGHAPRPGEIGHDPARPGRVHLEFAVAGPEAIPNLTFHRTEGALFSTTPFPGRGIPPILPVVATTESRLPAAGGPGGQAPGSDTRQDPDARRQAALSTQGEDAPAAAPSPATEVSGIGTRIKPFFRHPAGRLPPADTKTPPAFIPPVIFARQDVLPAMEDLPAMDDLPAVAGKPAAAQPLPEGGPAPFTGRTFLSARPSGQAVPPPDPARQAPTGEPFPHGAKIPSESGRHAVRLFPAPDAASTGIPDGGAALLREAFPVEQPHGGTALSAGRPEARPTRPGEEDARIGFPSGGAVKPRAERLAPLHAADAEVRTLEKRDTERRRAKVEMKEDVVPPPYLAPGTSHRFGADSVLFAANPVRTAPGRAGDETLAREVAHMVERFLVTADAGSYVKELHMTLNPDILPGTEIRFRMVDQSLTVTLLSKEGNVVERLRREAPELARSLRGLMGADVELRIETGEGRETL